MRLAFFPRALVAPLLVLASVSTALVAGLVAAPVVGAAPAVTAAAPGASNTGVPDGASLRRVDGTLVLDRAGATYSNLDIHGRVRVDAPNITLANSIVRGDNAKALGALIDCNHSTTNHSGFVVRDSTLVPQYPSAYYQAGILGHDFTVLRTEITKTVDAVHVVGNNVTVTRSWLHDTLYVSAAASPLHRDTHNDGVQVLGGANIRVAGNTISGNSNAAMQVTQDDGAVSGLRFTGNWSSGGGCTVNMVATPRTSIVGTVTVARNRFLHNTRVANCAIISGRGVTVSHPGNVWADTGKEVALSRGY